jgi:drug/metabolite transporter (DMT)-like permease
MLWSTAIAAPGLLLVALLLGEDVLPGSWGGWAACVGLGVVHVVGQGGVAWSLGRLPTALTAVTVLIQPIAAAILGWILFAETLTLVQAIGGGVVLGAIILAQLSSAPKKKDAEAVAPASP